MRAGTLSAAGAVWASAADASSAADALSATPAPGTEPAGPARDLTSISNGPNSAAAVTSDTSPVTAHRTTRVSCARATFSARAHAPARPSLQCSAAASAAKSAAPPAR